MDIFTYIGVGVVVGAAAGLLMGIVGDPPAWGIGAIAGPLAGVASWYVIRRQRAAS